MGLQVRPIPQQDPGPDPFQGVNEARQRHSRGVFHQKVDMVFLAIAFHQHRAETFGDGSEGAAQARQCIIVEHSVAVLCYKDQMHMQRCNYMSSRAIFHLALPQTKPYL